MNKFKTLSSELKSKVIQKEPRVDYQTLIGKRAKVVANNRFKGMAGTIIAVFEIEDLVMIKYDKDTSIYSKGMFPLKDLEIMEK